MKKKTEQLTIEEPRVDNAAIKAALNSYKNFKTSCNRDDYMLVVDYTLPSNEKRMHVYDLKNKNIVKSYICAHGERSSDRDNLAMAVEFSNREGSHMSSLGAMVTDNVYRGQHGYSLRLNGLEKCNDNVRRRGIVIHGAFYCEEKYVNDNKRAGQSHGCPALDLQLCNEVIQNYKGGCFYYAYYK